MVDVRDQVFDTAVVPLCCVLCAIANDCAMLHMGSECDSDCVWLSAKDSVQVLFSGHITPALRRQHCSLHHPTCCV